MEIRDEVLDWLSVDGGWSSTREVLLLFHPDREDALEVLRTWRDKGLVVSDNQGRPWWRALSDGERAAGADQAGRGR